MTEDIKILPSIRRLIHSKLALFCTESRGSDIYHFISAFEILRARVGDEPLKEHYKENYPKVIKRLRKMNLMANRLKLYYDSIKNFDAKDKEIRLKIIFEDYFIELPLINKTLFKCFELLLDKTEIRFMSIPREIFQNVIKETKSLTKTDQPKKDDKKDESRPK